MDLQWVGRTCASRLQMEHAVINSEETQQRGRPDDIKVCIDARRLNQIITKVPDNNLPELRKVLD